jgi:hypothetical protein
MSRRKSYQSWKMIVGQFGVLISQRTLRWVIAEWRMAWMRRVLFERMVGELVFGGGKSSSLGMRSKS